MAIKRRINLHGPGMVQGDRFSAPFIDLVNELIASADQQDTGTDLSGVQGDIDAITDGIARMRGTDGVEVLGSLESGLVIQGPEHATGVAPGSYTNADITVDEFGRVTLASSGGISISIVLGDWYYSIIPNANTASFWGFSTASLSTDGTTTAATLAATSAFSRQSRFNRATSSSAGNNAGRYPGTNSLVSCLDGGFRLITYFGVADAAAVANARLGVGFTAATGSVANVNPSTLTNVILVGADTGDTNLQVMHNDGSGSCTKVDCGVNFPANTLSTDWYEMTIEAQPGAGTVDVSVRRSNTGDVFNTTLSTNLPTGSTLLGPVLWRNNGTTALAATIADGGFYLRPNLDKSEASTASQADSGSCAALVAYGL